MTQLKLSILGLLLVLTACKANKEQIKPIVGTMTESVYASVTVHPKIIMGDEPTGNLDSKNSENVFNIFKELSVKNKLSLLVVTHDFDFAKKTDRIIEMEDGIII